MLIIERWQYKLIVTSNAKTHLQTWQKTHKILIYNLTKKFNQREIYVKAV